MELPSHMHTSSASVCEKVYDFEAMEMPRYTGEIGKGFRIDDTQLYYKGICPHCLEAMNEKEELN